MNPIRIEEGVNCPTLKEREGKRKVSGDASFCSVRIDVRFAKIASHPVMASKIEESASKFLVLTKTEERKNGRQFSQRNEGKR